jgi:hypothetical protein
MQFPRCSLRECQSQVLACPQWRSAAAAAAAKIVDDACTLTNSGSSKIPGRCRTDTFAVGQPSNRQGWVVEDHILPAVRHGTSRRPSLSFFIFPHVSLESRAQCNAFPSLPIAAGLRVSAIEPRRVRARDWSVSHHVLAATRSVIVTWLSETPAACGGTGDHQSASHCRPAPFNTRNIRRKCYINIRTLQNIKIPYSIHHQRRQS